jgi:hypothetical protein
VADLSGAMDAGTLVRGGWGETDLKIVFLRIIEMKYK